MERRLVALAVVEASIIVLLTAVLLSRTPTEAPAAGAAPPAPASLPDAVPQVARTAGGAAAAETSAIPVPPARTEVAAPQAGDALGTVLYGGVVGSDGAPVPQLSLWLSRPDEAGSISCSYEAGRGYAAPPLAPGRWRIRGRAEGYRDLENEIDVGGAPAQRHDLVFDRAFLLKVAVLTPDGQPISAALAAAELHRSELAAVATADEPPAAFPMTTLRSLHGLGVGRWRGVGFGGPELPERYLGLFELEAPPPVWVSVVHRHVVVAKVLVPAGQDEVELVVPVDSVAKTFGGATLQVVDAETGAPLENARVAFSDRQSGNPGVAADANGRATFDTLPPGILELTVRAPEKELYHCMLRIEPGVVRDLGTIAVDAATPLGGIVVGPDGQPAAGVSIHWYRLGRTAPDLPLDNGFSTRTDTEGAFRLFGAGRGRYLVTAVARGVGVGCTVVDATAGPRDDARITLAPSQVEIENRIPPACTYLLILRTREGYPVHARHIRPGPDYPIQVPPGRYVAEIRTDTELVRSFDLEVGGAEPARIVVP